MRSIFFLPFFILFTSISTACTCDHIGSWCEVVSGDIDIIIKGYVYYDDGEATYIEVIETIQGTPDSSHIRLPKGYTSCTNSIPASFINDTIIIALYKRDINDPNFVDIGDYYFLTCGKHILEIRGQKVFGNLPPEFPEMSYEVFKKEYKSCKYEKVILTGDVVPDLNFQYHIYSNQQPLQVQIIDLSGRVIIDKIYDHNEHYTINMELPELAPSMYFVRFIVGDSIETKKIILVR